MTKHGPTLPVHQTFPIRRLPDGKRTPSWGHSREGEPLVAVTALFAHLVLRLTFGERTWTNGTNVCDIIQHLCARMNFMGL